MKRLVASTLALAIGVAGPAAAAIMPSDDPILYWNDVALGGSFGSPPAQTRVLAILNIAMHDAVNRTYNGANNFYLSGVAAPGGNTRAAASVAAHSVLVNLNPANAAAYDAALTASLAQVADGQAKTNGIATGNAYAAAIIANRTGDGSGAVVPYTPAPPGTPGRWQPTPPANAPAAVTQWGGVTPFVMASGSQLRPTAPPMLGSAEWAFAYNEVKELGAVGSLTRTADQTASALFWGPANGLTWHRIAVELAADDGRSTIDNARLFALLSTAAADSQIAGFDAKYFFDFWRPVTAIQAGDIDGNPATEQDAGWTALNAAPAHPSYVSTLSALSASSAGVLQALLGDQAFCGTVGANQRCWGGFAQAIQDAADSRVWGGIHYSFDGAAGLEIGQQLSALTLSGDAFNAVPEPASWVMIIAGFGLAGAALRRRVTKVTYA